MIKKQALLSGRLRILGKEKQKINFTNVNKVEASIKALKYLKITCQEVHF